MTSPQAFEALRLAGRGVRRPDLTVATMDHNVPTWDRSLPVTDEIAAAADGDPGPELRGVRDHPLRPAQRRAGHRPRHRARAGPHPAGDDHRLRGQPHLHPRRLRRPGRSASAPPRWSTCSPRSACSRTARGRWRCAWTGASPRGVTAKDIILGIIGRIGTAGGTGYVVEYTGEAIRSLSMEGRMTVCNMSIEGGARAGMIAPDDTTFAYLEGRPHAPAGQGLRAGGGAPGGALPTDAGAALRPRGGLRRADAGALRHLGHQPGDGRPGHRPGARSGGRSPRRPTSGRRSGPWSTWG